VTAVVALPFAQAATRRIVGLIEGET